MVRINHGFWNLENGSVPKNYPCPEKLVDYIRFALTLVGFVDWDMIQIKAVVANRSLTLSKPVENALSSHPNAELLEVHANKEDVVKGSKVVDLKIEELIDKLVRERKNIANPPPESVLLIAGNKDAVKKLKKAGFTVLLMYYKNSASDDLIPLVDKSCNLLHVLTPSGLIWD